MATELLKVEVEMDCCCICNAEVELMTPEEYDASAPPMQVPLRSMLLHLNSNKVVPDGRLCANCAQRAVESYDFAVTLSTGNTPPLSEKIRALRRKLYELTQKIDVFIVVGGSDQSGTATYNEDDIIMVEKEALAAAAAADDEDMERARNARGDTVYQCSVCPQSFQRLAEYRAHCSSHPQESLHSCWTCGAQFASKSALSAHSETHSTARTQHLKCNLCNITFASSMLMRKHESSCSPVCPAPSCSFHADDRTALATHAAAVHGRGSSSPHVCPVCFVLLSEPDVLSQHLLSHRQAKHFICGYGGCILRFATRSNLMTHFRKCHSGADVEPDVDSEPTVAETETVQPRKHECDQCQRTFATAAALKRHSRVHRTLKQEPEVQEEKPEEILIVTDMDEEEVEYLEVETLDSEFQLDDEDYVQNLGLKMEP